MLTTFEHCPDKNKISIISSLVKPPITDGLPTPGL